MGFINIFFISNSLLDGRKARCDRELVSKIRFSRVRYTPFPLDSYDAVYLTTNTRGPYYY